MGLMQEEIKNEEFIIHLYGDIAFDGCHQEYSLSNEIVPKKNASCVANILDISTKLTPFFSLPSLPPSELNSISLTPLLTDFAYSFMLFILSLMHTAWQCASAEKSIT